MNTLATVGGLSIASWWWIGAGVLVAAELATGTFYLLMFAIGLAAAAIAAHLGLGGTAQVVVAAIIGSAGVGALYIKKRTLPRDAPASSNRDVNLDIGERVKVSHWHSDGSTEVKHRGANWQARYEGTLTGADAPVPGEYVILALDGNRLVLGK